MLSVEQMIRAAKDESYCRTLDAEELRQAQPDGLIALVQFIELSEAERCLRGGHPTEEDVT